MLDAIDKILQRDFDQWQIDIANDPILAYALVKLIEIIGEATYKLTPEFRQNHPDTNWDAIEGLRHILVHGYYKIKLPRVLDVVNEDIPLLRDQVTKYIEELQSPI